jgi:hypothetical protein
LVDAGGGAGALAAAGVRTGADSSGGPAAEPTETEAIVEPGEPGDAADEAAPDTCVAVFAGDPAGGGVAADGGPDEPGDLVAGPEVLPPAGGLLELGGVTGLAGAPLPEAFAGSGAAFAGGGPTGVLDPGAPALANCVAGGVAGAGSLAAVVAAASLAPMPIRPILNAP